ncbi:MAG: CPBP family intramembrane glutamic endopeptidase [Candidatus Limnocylindria bacterium]
MLTIVGFALGASAFVTGELASTGIVRPEARSILVTLGIVGGAMLFGGLVYTLVRQLYRRRVLPADRYRGPSIVLLLAFAILLATVATLPFTGDVNAILLGDGEPTLAGAIVLITSTQAALLLVTWAFVLRPRAVAFAEPLLGNGLPRALLVGAGWGVVAWFVASVVTYVIVLLFERLGLQPDQQAVERVLGYLEPWLIVVAVVILAPIAEEVFFRGVAFNAWLRERGRRFAYIGSAALFAAIHASLVSLVPIFLLGLALAWVYRRTGSLLAPIAMHATFNAISIGIALLARYEVIRLPV